MNKRQESSVVFVTKALRRSGISRNQVATISGLTNTYIQDLERGKIEKKNDNAIIHASSSSLNPPSCHVFISPACDRSQSR